MTKNSANQKSLQLQQNSGNWGSGKVDKNNPTVQKGIAAAKELQAQINKQKDLNVESLKRVVRL